MSLGLWVLLASTRATGVEPDFDDVVAPVLIERCLDCHSGGRPKGRLDLAEREAAFRGGKSGPAIVAGNPEDSPLWLRIEADEMPPEHPLSSQEKRLIADWIRAGARWGTSPIDRLSRSTARRAGLDWWALQPIVAREPPVVPTAEGEVSHPIDRFVEARLRAEGIEAASTADPRALVRRLFVDLIGLPPPLEVVDAFETDESPEAWSKLVDLLLASPRYGERWARHWLDVARFGESDGYEYNSPREAFWHYRDWVIRSLDDDLPYDEFASLQLAGDALRTDSIDGAAAVGFLVAGVRNTVVGNDPAMRAAARQEALEELVGAVSQTFLGLTVNCARCHDHKFDPISTEDYYRLSAAVAGVEHGVRELSSADGARIAVYTAVSIEPGAVHVLHRGDVSDPGEEVLPGGLAALRGLDAGFALERGATDRERRTRLARWITDEGNPLFPRVLVNRVWHHHFGVGLVHTPSDLGFTGGRPSHPELLDWLADGFRRQGYSIKRLHRSIVTSRAYRRASEAGAERREQDSANRLLWRQNARRVEAEVLRDSLLAVAGTLRSEMFGPGYRDVELVAVPPANYYVPIDPIGPAYDRRTIYRWSVRGQRSALLDTFDCPDPSVGAPTRSVTTTPAQALCQWNHPFLLRAAAGLARRVEAEVEGRPEPRRSQEEALVEAAWLRVLARSPSAGERERATRLVRERGLDLLCRVLLNSNELVWID